ncbi:uncharacterized protein [Triticum aestivum]|uniref:uncharacterized protein isoform X1 n=1 Tax=Triticum aestivum TaxID=4565 RepID=UPI001D01839A|nr:uncharacterized protein LOC123181077 isoform X1 [Triticum aestivum]
MVGLEGSALLDEERMDRHGLSDTGGLSCVGGVSLLAPGTAFSTDFSILQELRTEKLFREYLEYSEDSFKWAAEELVAACNSPVCTDHWVAISANLHSPSPQMLGIVGIIILCVCRLICFSRLCLMRGFFKSTFSILCRYVNSILWLLMMLMEVKKVWLMMDHHVSRLRLRSNSSAVRMYVFAAEFCSFCTCLLPAGCLRCIIVCCYHYIKYVVTII